MTINDKIKQILIDKNLSPSYFADEIGVQRSSISHILSGRNRPSFDIIQKIIRRFPELGYDWIMEDEGLPTNQMHYTTRGLNRSMTDRPDPIVSKSSPSNNPYSAQSPVVRSQRHEIPPVAMIPAPVTETPPYQDSTTINPGSDKKVERILIFYTDGSFREYTPTNS